jgi:hypothetical protein
MHQAQFWGFCFSALLCFALLVLVFSCILELEGFWPREVPLIEVFPDIERTKRSRTRVFDWFDFLLLVLYKALCDGCSFLLLWFGNKTLVSYVVNADVNSWLDGLVVSAFACLFASVLCCVVALMMDFVCVVAATAL